MIKIQEDEINSEIKGISVRFPRKLSNRIKSEAAIRGITKDELFKKLVLLGCENFTD